MYYVHLFHSVVLPKPKPRAEAKAGARLGFVVLQQISSLTRQLLPIVFGHKLAASFIIITIIILLVVVASKFFALRSSFYDYRWAQANSLELCSASNDVAKCLLGNDELLLKEAPKDVLTEHYIRTEELKHPPHLILI